MNSTTGRWRSQSPRMSWSVSGRADETIPCRAAESCMACSERANVVSRSETLPSRKVSSPGTASECTRGGSAPDHNALAAACMVVPRRMQHVVAASAEYDVHASTRGVHDVVAAAGRHEVVAGARADAVVVAPADEDVAARPAVDAVVAAAAVHQVLPRAAVDVVETGSAVQAVEPAASQQPVRAGEAAHRVAAARSHERLRVARSAPDAAAPVAPDRLPAGQRRPADAERVHHLPLGPRTRPNRPRSAADAEHRRGERVVPEAWEPLPDTVVEAH